MLELDGGENTASALLPLWASEICHKWKPEAKELGPKATLFQAPRAKLKHKPALRNSQKQLGQVALRKVCQC